MKTPDEIKKGLECCILETDDTSLVDHCRACPYQPTGLCFRTLLKDILAYIQQLEAQVPKWISVEERLPENDVDVLVYDRLDGAGVCQYSSVLREFFGDVEGTYAEVTHWMPLPKVPEESFHD